MASTDEPREPLEDLYDTEDGVPSDAELITAVRTGDDTAFGVLWQRHEGAALRLARQITNPSNAEDLVSESFARLLRVLRQGGGPDGAFRPYLFSTLRRLNIDNARSYSQRISLTGDDSDLETEPAASAADVAAGNAENSAAWKAWASLPESSRTLLWHLVVEEETPAQIAPLIGTSPNGVSSRAVRARERLRQAFLQQHVAEAVDDKCRWARSRMSEYVRDALSARDRSALDAHLSECDSCPAVLFEITDVNQTLRVVIAPIILGGVGLGAYLSGLGSGTGSAGAAAAPHHGGVWKLVGTTTGKGVLIGAASVLLAGAVAVGATIAVRQSPPTHAAAAATRASDTPLQTPTPAPSTTPPPSPAAVTSVAVTSPPVAATSVPAITVPTTRPSTAKTVSVPHTTAVSIPNVSAVVPIVPVDPPAVPVGPITKSVTLVIDVTNSAYSGTNDTVDLVVPATWSIALTSAPVAGCTPVSAHEITCALPTVNPSGGQNHDGKYDFVLSAVGPSTDHTSLATLFYTDQSLYNHSEIDQQAINPS